MERFSLGGPFTSVGGTARNRIARLNNDGNLDTGFNPNANSEVRTVAVQADGKILLGGSFTSVGGVARNRIARLNGNGSLDPEFYPNANSEVYSIAVQADEKILLGGPFTSINKMTRHRIARLNSDGSLDTGFNPDAGGSGSTLVASVAVQADGKILLGGFFTSVGGMTRNNIARLNSDGSVDNGFDPNTNNVVYSAPVQADGKILPGGFFTSVGGTPRNRFARLNNDNAPQSLSAPDTTQVQWFRGGAAPEVEQVTFELSTDAGATWTPLGSGTRIVGGWELSRLSLPTSGSLRARGRTTNGLQNSSGLLEQVANFCCGGAQ